MLFDLFLHFAVYDQLKRSSIHYKETVPDGAHLKYKWSVLYVRVRHFFFDIFELAFWEVVEDEMIFEGC